MTLCPLESVECFGSGDGHVAGRVIPARRSRTAAGPRRQPLFGHSDGLSGPLSTLAFVAVSGSPPLAKIALHVVQFVLG